MLPVRITLCFLFLFSCLACSEVPPIDEADLLSDTTRIDDETIANADPYDWVDPATIKFSDDAQTNAKYKDDLFDLEFVDYDGKKVELRDYRGKRNVVLVITRGVIDQLCPFCTTQTSRLITNRAEFESRNAEVLVVIPGKKSGIDAIRKKVAQVAKKEIDLPILLDEELNLVKRLAITDKLAKPSTFILDREGKLRFAYVGKTAQDRPSLKALWHELDQIESENSESGAQHDVEREDTPSSNPTQ